MKAAAVLLGAALVLGGNVAQAALSSSERGQIRDFVASAQPSNAHKVRSLVARTDLGPDESVAVLTESVAPVAWSDARGVFLKELVFGASSAPSRPILVLATVKALLARADAVYGRYVGGLDHEPRAIQELSAIYGWLDQAIANAGQPTASQHDGSAGVPQATYEECSKALREHIDRNARWLKGSGAIAESVGRLRAQAQLALVDMLPDGLTRRVDAADRLGLAGARRSMLVDWGVLFADAGTLDDTKVARIREIMARVPGARRDLGVVYAGSDRAFPLRARGTVVSVAPATERYPFGDDAAPVGHDAIASAITHDLAVVAAKRALDARPELRAQSERDATAGAKDPARLLGRPRAPSVEHVVAAAMHALLTDAPKAIDVALSRLRGGKPEAAALLADALGALVAVSGEGDGGRASKADVGSGTGWTTVSAVHLDPAGAAIGFTLDGHVWAIDRGAQVVVDMRRDGAAASPGRK